jgi:iron complex transport system ATP-binding protein
MADALTLRNVGVALSGKPIVNDVSFDIQPGTLFGILGPNGAGKTTLLKAIAGLIPHQGLIAYGERDLSTLEARQRARLIAYVPQRSQLSAALSAASVVAQGRYCHGSDLGALSALDREAIDHALHTVNARGLSNRPFTELSGGEQRRVLLARALATQAPVILLDEPTASLDIAHALTLFHHMKHLAREGRTLVVVLHDLSDASTWCEHLALLSAGTLVAQGKPESVLSADRIREIYGVEGLQRTALTFELLGKQP